MGRPLARHLVPVRSEELQPGMYVAELDRSWLHVPLPAAGFLITDQAQVEQLQQLCHHVYVDAALSEQPPARDATATQRATTAIRPTATGERLLAARRVLDEVLHGMAAIVRDARQRGRIDKAAVARCAVLLAGEAGGNAPMLHYCLRREEHGSFLCRRAAGTALAVNLLGQRLGIDRHTLQELTIGALLLDLGKIAVPVPILAKPAALSSEEQLYVRRHVERGLEFVAAAELPARAVEMIATHHERLDGSGYPQQLCGTAIPVFGRLAAIADAYDAMTLNRRYAAALSPSAALRQLTGLAGDQFDAALVGELAGALGPYPSGTLVELADGSVGLVHAGPPAQPEVLLSHDAQRRPLAVPAVVFVGDEADIFRALPPNAVAIGPAELERALGCRPAAGS